MNNNVKIFSIVIVILILGVAGTALIRSNSTPPGPGKYDAFAQCLKEKGTTFYGAFWCPHCQDQEKLLEASRSTLEKEGLYVECSNLDAQSQTQICIDKKIESYPTWEFADGSRLTGVIPLTQLAEKTGCELPQ